MLGLGVTPSEILLQAVGSADDPASGGRQMPCHWGYKSLNMVTQSSATGSQCLPAVGCAEAARYIVPAPDLPGCKAHGDELTYVSLGEGATSEGEFWESLNTACTLHLPGPLRGGGQRLRHLGARRRTSRRRPSANWSGASGAWRSTRWTGGTTSPAAAGRRGAARVRAGEGPALIHATVTRPYSHSAADTQSKYRAAEELADEQAHDPIDCSRAELVVRGHPHR